MTPVESCDLLLAHAGTGQPVLPEGIALGPEAAAAAIRAKLKGFLWEAGGDPNSLMAQRWGVLAPVGPEGDRLLKLIQPLIDLRKSQSPKGEVAVCRVPPLNTLSEALRWYKREFDDSSDIPIEKPRYQLILGDLDQVSLAVQQAQSLDGYVGRLAFREDEGYEAYVHKLIKWEQQRAATPGNSLFYTVRDGTQATNLGYRALVTPGLAIANKRQAAGEYPAQKILEVGAPFVSSPDELLTAAAPGVPGVLFTLSHGDGAPKGGWKSVAEQQARQGAMSFGRSGSLVAADLRGKPFLPGGVWFMLACYSAGTPTGSVYAPWIAELAKTGNFKGRVEAVIESLPKAGEKPFIAALPQAVLSSPDGPLAVIGHVDLAWTYSFRDLDAEGVAYNRPARIITILRSVLRGDRVGLAFRELLRFFNQTNTELTTLYEPESTQLTAAPLRPLTPQELNRRAHLWMLRHDLAGYILLGDPAVQLPVTLPTAQPEPAAPNLNALFGFNTLPSGAAPAPPGLSLRELEEAVGHALVGQRDLAELAQTYKLAQSELQKLVDLYRNGGRDALRRQGRLPST